ncbi:MAG: FtsX-like permease family protein [Vicinamibacterales bacterium]
MTLPFELHVALRYLLARRKQAFISVISFISTLGVVVGVMALVLALALMTGLQNELRDRILGSTAHVFVWKIGGYEDYRAESARLQSFPNVVGAAPAVIGQGLVTTDRGSAFISLKGIDPELERHVTNIGRSVTPGALEALAGADEESPPGIILGKDLAEKIGVSPGDGVNVLTTEGTVSPWGVLPRTRRLSVVGVFDLGLYEFDSTYGFVSLPVARRLVGEDRVSLIELRVDDLYRAPEIAANIGKELGPSYVADDWSDMNRSLFSALWLEKMAISITIGLIVMVAALNIVASLILLVMEKNRDIAILKTMGASARSIMAVFMLQGLVIGLVGTFLGAAGGLAVSRLADRYQLVRIPGDVYQISYVPFALQGIDLLVVVAGAVATCFLATVYPARQAAQLDPAEALRYG